MSGLILVVTAFATVALIASVARYLRDVVGLAVAYKAKILCSGVFVSGRTEQDVSRTDLALDNHHYFRWIPAVVDTGGCVQAGWRGLVYGVAIHRP